MKVNAMNRKELLNEAVFWFGKEKQIDMCIEEMAELTKELLKDRRGLLPNKSTVLEEMADVQIMLDQMRIIYGPTTDYENTKLARLAEKKFNSIYEENRH